MYVEVLFQKDDQYFNICIYSTNNISKVCLSYRKLNLYTQYYQVQYNMYVKI